MFFKKLFLNAFSIKGGRGGWKSHVDTKKNRILLFCFSPVVTKRQKKGEGIGNGKGREGKERGRGEMIEKGKLDRWSSVLK